MHHNEIIKVLGKIEFNNSSFVDVPFEENRISFLNEISKEILKNKKINKYPDLISFGFWCRSRNLKNYKKMFNNTDTSLGRGLALHIPPSNVPMTTAYTFAFGIISGCTNIIRLPSKNFEQIKIFLKIIKKIINKKYSFLRKSFCFIKYDKSDKISESLCQIVDVRLIWGGDKTIQTFKKYKTKIKTLDLFFPDKISGAIINSSKLKRDIHEMNSLVLKFYNDSYTMDQMGCSSPKIIFWNGKNELIKSKFFNQLNKIVKNKNYLNFKTINSKTKILHDFILNSKYTNKEKNFSPLVSLIKIKGIKNLNEYKNLAYGAFLFVNIKNLKDIKKFINNKFQTLTFFGYKKQELKRFIIKNRLSIDRIVPIGNAFDMSTNWDGYEIIKYMTRIID